MRSVFDLVCYALALKRLEVTMRRETKIGNIRAMIDRAGLADRVDAVYDSEHMTVRAVLGKRLPSSEEEQVISDIFDSCAGVYIWLNGELRIRRAQHSINARRARRLYGKQTKASD
jgi:hypothetical protein